MCDETLFLYVKHVQSDDGHDALAAYCKNLHIEISAPDTRVMIKVADSHTSCNLEIICTGTPLSG